MNIFLKRKCLGSRYDKIVYLAFLISWYSFCQHYINILIPVPLGISHFIIPMRYFRIFLRNTDYANWIPVYPYWKPFLWSVIDRHLAELKATIAVRAFSADGRASRFYKRRTQSWLRHLTFFSVSLSTAFLYGTRIMIPSVAGTMLKVKEKGGLT